MCRFFAQQLKVSLFQFSLYTLPLFRFCWGQVDNALAGAALKGMPGHTLIGLSQVFCWCNVTFWFFEQSNPQKAVAQRGKIRYGLLGSSAEEIPTPVCQPDTFDSIMVFMGPLKNRLSWWKLLQPFSKWGWLVRLSWRRALPLKLFPPWHK